MSSAIFDQTIISFPCVLCLTAKIYLVSGIYRQLPSAAVFSGVTRGTTCVHSSQTHALSGQFLLIMHSSNTETIG